MANIKNLVVIFFLINVLVMIYGHQELTMSSHEAGPPRAKESLEWYSTEQEIRRRLLKEKWQHEGIPLDFPSRTSVDSSEKKEMTTRASSMNVRFRRIYNADETASVSDYPFMAAVLQNMQYWCAGVILDLDKVLTAAHCLQLQYNNRFFREYVKMLTVRVGSNNATAGGEMLHVTEIFFHPNYKPDILGFNFAILKLHKSIALDKRGLRVRPIDYFKDKTVPIDKNITFLGWGSVLGYSGPGGEVLLQKVDMPVYDLADCQLIYGRVLVTRNNFCAGYITVAKNVCNHDAGGPAIMDGRLVGILSFSAKRCDRADRPAVFSTVGAVEPWIAGVGVTTTVKAGQSHLVSGLNRH